MNRFLVLFGSIWLVVGLPFAVAGIWLAHADRAFAREARIASGIVLSKDVTRDTDSDGSTSTTYSIRYRFRSTDGVVHEGRSDVGRARWNRLVEREPVEIEYAASNPAKHRVRGTSNALLAIIFTGLGGLFTVAGAFILFAGVRAGRRRARLLEHGTPAEAVVTHVRTTNVSINKRRQARVHYRFRDQRGQEHLGRSDYLPAAEAARWKAGDRIRIRYDRERPQDSTWDVAQEQPRA